MPFAQISLKKGTTPAFRTTLMEEIYLAMRESIGSPEDDRFATITELDEGNFNSSGNYLGIERSDDVVFIQITLNSGRTVDQKKALYAAIARGLQAELDVRPEDIVVNLVDVPKENWSLGNGVAQYA